MIILVQLKIDRHKENDFFCISVKTCHSFHLHCLNFMQFALRNFNSTLVKHHPMSSCFLWQDLCLLYYRHNFNTKGCTKILFIRADRMSVAYFFHPKERLYQRVGTVGTIQRESMHLSYHNWKTSHTGKYQLHIFELPFLSLTLAM